ncbi:MAG: hypothetical protein KGD64_07770 [Candidatus Heimdallarchaeota archaeon]|nr:hypothetical protein [Candidatus Heimdallarchaeota archaeon]
MNRKYIFALILIVGMMSGSLTTTMAYDTAITTTGATFAFDLSHGGYHTTMDDLGPLMDNLTLAGNTVLLINETWELPDKVDALFLTQSDDEFTAAEKADIKAWLGIGDKLLIAVGDSDYAGIFQPAPINNLLAYIGAMLRLDATSIEDPEFNDGSAYRVGANELGYGNDLYDDLVYNLTEGMEAGIILHGPCAVLAFDGYYYKDIRLDYTVFNRLEVLITYGRNGTSIDSDVSETELDLYAGETGYIPAVVYEYLPNLNDSHLIVGGEAFYTHYKFMYDQTTENGVYHDGVHYGQMFVNNIINWFVKTPTASSYEFAFAVIPLAIIGVIYVLMKKRK